MMRVLVVGVVVFVAAAAFAAYTVYRLNPILAALDDGER